MAESTLCLNAVQWREVGEEPVADAGWMVNQSTPQIHEERWVRIENDFQASDGSRVWLLFQPPESAINAMVDNLEEMESSFVVEVEILEQKTVPTIYSWGGGWNSGFWVKVRCLTIAPLYQIPKVFPKSKPTSWPRAGAEVRAWNSPYLVYYDVASPECADWFLATNAHPPRMILRGEQPNCSNAPIEICNCEFDPKQWKHTK